MTTSNIGPAIVHICTFALIYKVIVRSTRELSKLQRIVQPTRYSPIYDRIVLTATIPSSQTEEVLHDNFGYAGQHSVAILDDRWIGDQYTLVENDCSHQMMHRTWVSPSGRVCCLNLSLLWNVAVLHVVESKHNVKMHG